jgi:hypothetical protein
VDDRLRVERLRAHLQGKRIPLYAVSAVTGEGLAPLVEAMWNEVARRREAPSTPVAE